MNKKTQQFSIAFLLRPSPRPSRPRCGIYVGSHRPAKPCSCRRKSSPTGVELKFNWFRSLSNSGGIDVESLNVVPDSFKLRSDAIPASCLRHRWPIDPHLHEFRLSEAVAPANNKAESSGAAMVLYGEGLIFSIFEASSSLDPPTYSTADFPRHGYAFDGSVVASPTSPECDEISTLSSAGTVVDPY